MFEFTAIERASLNEMRSITTDGQGREVLVGLDYTETEQFMNRRRRCAAGLRDDEGRAAWLALARRHDLARLQVLGAEIALRNDKTSMEFSADQKTGLAIINNG